MKIFEDVTQNFDLVPLFIQRRHVHRALQDVGQRRRLEVLTVDHDHRLKMEKIKLVIKPNNSFSRFFD